MNQKGFIKIIMLIAVIVLLGGTGFYLVSNRQIQPQPASLPSNTNGLHIVEQNNPGLEWTEADCARALAAQKEYLKNDTLATTETFEKYPVDNILQTTPADLDTGSNKLANEFRTRIREELASKGVNFAGSYSLISVGMTGWGQNYYIVDRKTGYAYIFPYYAEFLEFRKDSSLIIMNPKSAIIDLINLMNEKEGNNKGCYLLHQQLSADLRSFYFLWEDNQLILIGPKDIMPPPNRFWTE